MPKQIVNGVELFYQLDGTGNEVVIILNGIMMSTASWDELVGVYSKDYRVLRVDFRNQGKSQYIYESFAIDVHAEDLKCLLDILGINKAHFAGISYGAEVAMLFALKHQAMVSSLVLSNTTARVTNHLRAIGDSWDEAAKLYNGESLFKLVMPFIYSSSFYESNRQWLRDREILFGRILKKEWFDAYMRLSASTEGYNILDRLHEIKVPTLCIASDLDIITPIAELKMIHERIQSSKLIIIPDAGHASCYEKKDEFNAAVYGFLKAVAG